MASMPNKNLGVYMKKLNFEDYKLFCKENQLRECEYNSLAQFIKHNIIEVPKRNKLILVGGVK